MKCKALLIMAAIAVASLALMDLTGPAHAQLGGGYELTWSSIDGGGYMFSAGDGYSLGGAIGQPDAGRMTGSGYALAGGFWSGVASAYNIYLPVVLRQ